MLTILFLYVKVYTMYTVCEGLHYVHCMWRFTLCTLYVEGLHYVHCMLKVHICVLQHFISRIAMKWCSHFALSVYLQSSAILISTNYDSGCHKMKLQCLWWELKCYYIFNWKFHNFNTLCPMNVIPMGCILLRDAYVRNQRIRWDSDGFSKWCKWTNTVLYSPDDGLWWPKHVVR
jgi:hypothetical protein